MHRKFVLSFLFVAMLAAVIPASSASVSALPWWCMGIGSIYNAKTLPDGSHVDLVLEDIVKIKDAYIVIAEPFRAQDRLIVLTVPDQLLRLGQVIDVSGDLTSLPSGERALQNVTILGYTSAETGELLYHPGIIKAFPDSAQREWPWMIDLTVTEAVGVASEISASISSELPTSDPAEGPTYYSKISDLHKDATTQTQSVRVQSYYNGIPDLDGLPAGSLVELQCKRITGVGTEIIDSITYKYLDIAEDLPATDTIRCYYSDGTPTTDDRVNRVTGQVQYIDTVQIICIDDGPDYDPQILEGKLHIIAEGLVAYAWTCPDNMTVSLPGKVVMADRTDLSGNRLYVEEPGRSAGILVVYTGTGEAVRGATVDITGTVDTLSSGERWIDAGSSGITVITPGEPVPAVLGLINRACGGSDFNVLTLGPDTPSAPGLYNVGLLVKTWGRVTGAYPSEKCFYLDDGSGLDDTNSHSVLGLKVSWDWQAISQENPEVVPPTPGWYITTTGISSIESTTTSGRARVLRLRDQADVYSLPDTTSPTPGTASSPAYVTSSPITVTYSGASDSVSGLKKVELWYKKGHTGTWTYSEYYSAASSGSFNFPVTEENTYYFDLVAEDNAENRSASPTGDGDCNTIYEVNLSATGRSFVHNEYLYPGGPRIRSAVYDDQGAQVRQTTLTYGLEGEVLSQSGSAELAGYTYDAAYRLKTISDGKNQTTSYTYDLIGNLTQIDLPGTDTIQYPEHDPLGNVLKRIDPNGVTTEYKYDDPESLLTDIEYPATQSLNVHYDYDSVYGRLTNVQDSTGTTTFGYDDLDILAGSTTTYTGLPARTVEYTYWPNASLDTMTTPVGDFTYDYDGAGRPTGLTNPFSQSFSWGYYNNNWLQTQTSPVSVSSFGYNPRGFLTSLSNSKLDQTLLSEFSGTSGMVYDAVGNLKSVSVNIPGVTALSGATNYTYDIKNQLTEELSTRNSGYTNDFVYDDAGNPTSFKGASRTYNSRNQNTAFTYNANGNPTSYDGSTLVYDPENRLTQYGSAMSAAYSWDGLRAWKESGTARTYFLYAGGVPVCEMDDDGSVLTVNTFGPSGLLSRREGATSVFYTYDPQGSVVQTLDSSAIATSTQLYDTYGNLLAGTATAPFGYDAQHGYYTDSETGLQLLSHRYYDPAEGRFLTRDPIGYAGGMNLYGYVGNNPANAVDPSGFCGDGGWGHEIARQAAQGASAANDDILDRMGPGPVQTVLAGLAMTANDVGASLFGILDLGTGSGRVAGGDYSAGAIIGAVGDVITVATVGAGIYGKVAAGAAAETSTLPITGYTEHGIEQAILRNGHGVSPKAILDAVKNPLEVIPQPERGTILYVGKSAKVSLNEAGEVVTTWATNKAGWRY